MKKVLLKDFFNNTCEYTWCNHNNCGYCEQENDIEHYRNIIEEVAENYGTAVGTFTCHSFNTSECLCSECGTELVEVDYTIEPRFPLTRYECPKCN